MGTFGLYLNDTSYFFYYEVNTSFFPKTDELMEGYIKSGYPSLQEVVKSLYTHTRIEMLRKAGFWKEGDIGCLEFVAGISEC